MVVTDPVQLCLRYRTPDGPFASGRPGTGSWWLARCASKSDTCLQGRMHTAEQADYAIENLGS